MAASFSGTGGRHNSKRKREVKKHELRTVFSFVVGMIRNNKSETSFVVGKLMRKCKFIYDEDTVCFSTVGEMRHHNLQARSSNVNNTDSKSDLVENIPQQSACVKKFPENGRNSMQNNPFYEGSADVNILSRPCTQPNTPSRQSLFSVPDRLASYIHWPSDAPVPSTRLVDAGFSHLEDYTCKCSECGLIIDTKTLNGRQPLEMHIRLRPDCEFIKQIENSSHGHGVSNGPNSHSSVDSTDFHRSSAQSFSSRDPQITAFRIVGYAARNPLMVTDQRRRETYRFFPEDRCDVDRLVEAGFFFTGDNDVVRCFHCDIGLADWRYDDDPWTEHARHSPECPYLKLKKPQQYIDRIREEWVSLYTPKHTRYGDEKSRLDSFKNGQWPRDQVTQSPKDLAEAGFFYTGEGDTVRCHYCDGGMREWEPNDIPWVEHARWFPFCKFVQQVKGVQYIQSCATGNPSSNTSDSLSTTDSASSNNATSSNNAAGQSAEDRCGKGDMYTDAAEAVASMGYSKTVIRHAINEYIDNNGCRDFHAADLMKIILDKEDAGELWSDEDTRESPTDDGGPSAQAGLDCDSDDELELSAGMDNLLRENEYLKKRTLCIVCEERDRCMVNLPCGHRNTCEICSNIRCLHCNSVIVKRIKTYLA